MLSSLEVKKKRASNNRKEKETLNRSSEERVEDDRGDELMMEMDTALKIGRRP